MVSGWTLPGLLSAEPVSKIMESCIEKSNCCNQGSSVEDKSFSVTAVEARTWFLVGDRAGCQPIRPHLIVTHLNFEVFPAL